MEKESNILRKKLQVESHRRKSSEKVQSQSLIFRNKLTKSYFSLHDTSLSDRVLEQKKVVKKIIEVPKIKNATSNLIRKFSLNLQDTNHNINITENKVPQIKFTKKPAAPISTVSSFKRTKSTMNYNHNKFKLLFKEVKQQKSASEKKIDRLNRKIDALSRHNSLLKSIKISEKIVDSPVKSLSKGIMVEEGLIKKMAAALIKNLNIFWNMYGNEKKVAVMLRSLDGFSEKIEKVLFLEKFKAKDIRDEREILKHFWLFSEESKRPEFFGEEDLNLYNILQNFNSKMDRSYNENKTIFMDKETTKLEKIKTDINLKIKIPISIQQTLPETIEDVFQFISNRKRHTQDRRESSILKLESLGVKFDLGERNREFILSHRERVISNVTLSKNKQNY